MSKKFKVLAEPSSVPAGVAPAGGVRLVSHSVAPGPGLIQNLINGFPVEGIPVVALRSTATSSITATARRWVRASAPASPRYWPTKMEADWSG